MILYIGNNLSKTTNNVTTLQLLTKLLQSEAYEVKCTSSQKNQVLRLLAMLVSMVKYRNKITYILIDTYSTKNFYYAFLTSQLARLLQLKYVPILHGGHLPKRLKTSPKMSQLIFSNSYKNVAPSNYLKKAFEKEGFATLFIPNVLEIDAYKFKERTHFQPKLLYVRAFQKLYNPQMAIKVLAELKKDYPLAELCMVGPDKDGSLLACRTLADKLNVGNAIRFTGLLPKKDWHELSENFDVFINTTTADNTPISVMEAMALGLVVVSTNVGGVPYLIEDQKTGILVNSNAVLAMTEKIKGILCNPLIYNKMIVSARADVAQFDWAVVKEKWKAILK